MTPTTTTRRRLAAAAAASALLMIAACGSDDSSESDDAAGDSLSPFPVATVTGEVGEEPVITLEDDAEAADEAVIQTLAEGDGPEITDGDYLRASVMVQIPGSDDGPLIDTWNPALPDDADGEVGANAEEGAVESEPMYAPIRVGVDEVLPAAVSSHLVGEAEGSRVMVQDRGSEYFGDQVSDLGMDAEDTLVFVIDVVTVVDSQGMVEGEQASPDEGMPEVSAEGPEPATITIPEDEDAPEEMREQVLIEGDGPAVESETQLIAQYTGVKWSDGEIFDSSWNQDSAANFPIGIGRVITGWDEGLVGKNVGDRVLLVIPPEQGYGADETSELKDETLVFVVDILEAI